MAAPRLASQPTPLQCRVD